MNTNHLADIVVTPLRRFEVDDGDVLHGLKRTDTGYKDFGEAYFSFIKPGRVKAWKIHSRMTLNLIVPIGLVRFVFHVPTEGNSFRVEDIGESNHARLTVPPGIWFGFQGLASTNSLVTNIADIPHDPGEVQRREVQGFNYEW